MSSTLIVRLGAMGDIIHALPAVASLRLSFPQQKIAWLVAPRWMPLLKGNPAVDQLLPFERKTLSGLRSTAARLRQLRPEMAIDFQGLIQSALAGRFARPQRFWGFSRQIAREPVAAFFYNHRLTPPGPHRVQSNLQLAEAAGAHQLTSRAWLPPGVPDGALPNGPFILASPFAGWMGKEWPLPCYSELAKRLRREGLRLVLNVSVARAAEVRALENVDVHSSSLEGLIHATREAIGVVGLDSGPLHLAAALDKPGVAIYGPTDPALTGPFGGTISVLRAHQVSSTYKRNSQIHASMRAITVDQVHAALMSSVEQCRAGRAV